MIRKLLIVAIVLQYVSCSSVERRPSHTESSRSHEYWKDHIKFDLMSFWERGGGLSDFSTFRCNDGTALDLKNRCEEWKKPPGWLKDHLTKARLRIISRQVYTLGVAFHTTGEKKYIDAAFHGLNIMRKDFNWGKPERMYSYIEDGVPNEDFLNRTSQDLSYAIVGPAFLYYLTGDQVLLKEIVKTKNYIFKNYWNKKFFSWVNLKSKNKKELARDELVSVLDQVNAYMMLITRSLPPKLASEWKSELGTLADYMIKHYWDAKTKRFWGTRGLLDSEKNNGRHNDFGHAIKTYWMILHIGKHIGRNDLVNFVTKNAPNILSMAYDSEGKAWGNSIDENGELVLNKDCWIYNELNQASMALSFLDPSIHNYLNNTLPFWGSNFVDPEFGEVWHVIDPKGVPILPYKSHMWKNGFHATEHALVAMIYTAKNTKSDLELFYLPSQSTTEVWRDKLNPHYFKATKKEVLSLGKILKVTFNSIGL